MTNSTTNPSGGGLPTQLAHPGRAVLRFVVAWVVGLVIAWLARTVGLDLADLSAPIIDGITAVVALVVASLVQWFLTLPGVEEFLARGKARSVLATGVHTEQHVISDPPDEPWYPEDEPRYPDALPF